ncbi:lipopolysaccharide biosynthesis protein [Mesorhizobium loti]|uniref:Lipopolysaccharide biosynthesis protein n=1 Tax=Mesorhizobium jarvisii TaxID=1777867 RepID=A0A6M7TKE5_9HYPH|nr:MULTISPECIES: glycosyl transferase family 90 [Mesorhizobium]OBQ68290.1 lipopolysaccharide biosynthesis protein [Mesorhizobium loti]QKC65290.1 lipopolysaccharide biosynthesis protein [Mesorhizobium jarvisii]QKD11205.1 lipopolysaccharide biosynthesis protein [Mesorhizobium loti]RJT30988.1 lipopolysaccharide biosynthesis protein [Mesorhizobium jarvisii]BCH02731.1 LPS protein [Mesorhizobium sp. 131-2-5]
MATIARTSARVFYYARNVVRDVIPQALFRLRLAARLEQAMLSDEAARRRLNDYNKLQDGFAPSANAVHISKLPFTPTMYYYDLKEFARYFDPGLLIDVEFGDVRDVPKVPTIVKDRPIRDDDQNAVIMKLDKFRHFQMPADATSFADKLPMVVWRGDLNNPIRTRFLQAVRDLPFCDAGSHKPNAPAEYAKPFLSISQHQRYRYIVSLEGNDVATNLKWILNSKSLCLMPPPTYETWFAERQLEANVHYVPLDPDFADLGEKVRYFERHPAQAERIIAAANAYCRKFSNERDEQAISLLVLYKYFVLSGQIEPGPELWRFIQG